MTKTKNLELLHVGVRIRSYDQSDSLKVYILRRFEALWWLLIFEAKFFQHALRGNRFILKDVWWSFSGLLCCVAAEDIHSDKIGSNSYKMRSNNTYVCCIFGREGSFSFLCVCEQARLHMLKMCYFSEKRIKIMQFPPFLQRNILWLCSQSSVFQKDK